MKALIECDAQFGNTERIAKAIGNAVAGEIHVVHAGQAHPTTLESMDLLIVGSPTHGWRQMAATKEFLGAIPDPALLAGAVRECASQHGEL